MAKTQTDYEAEGAQLFKDGKERPEGNSWQAKARLKGYETARYENELRVDDELNQELRNMKTPAHVEEIDTLKLPPGKYAGKLSDNEINRMVKVIRSNPPKIVKHKIPGQAVKEHLMRLKQIRLETTDDNKYDRINEKIAKLVRKYGFGIHHA